MASVEIGQRPPSFRLASGQGGHVAPEDFYGRSHLIVWFTKGMACPFCRTQMSQLARGYARIQALGAEVLQVTPTTPERARFYAQSFTIPFPYLCDPDYRTHRAWGLDVRSHSLAWYAKTFYQASTMTPPPPAEIGNPNTPLRELPRILDDSDMGFFVIDRGGIVRYKLAGSYMDEQSSRKIPTVDEIARELERCTSSSPSAAAG